MADLYGLDGVEEEEFVSSEDTAGSATSQPTVVQQPRVVTTLVDWPTYQKSRIKDDPFEVYRDYIGKEFYSYLKGKGYSPQKIEATQVALMKQLPPPARKQEPIDEGFVSNALSSIKLAAQHAFTELEAGKAIAAGDTQGLLKATRETRELEEKTPSPLKRFREAAGTGEGVWDAIKGTAVATYETPEGAFDALLGMLVGFTPFIAGGSIGGFAGSAAGPVGSIAGTAVGVAGASAALAAGAKGIQKLQEAAAKDKIDITDEAAVQQWIKNGGAEKVYGPAIRASLTNGAITLLTMGVSGALGAQANKLLGKMSPEAAGSATADLAALRTGVKKASVGELATNVGGFTAASVGGELAAGDTPTARAAFENALVLLLPGLGHLRSRTKQAKQLEQSTGELQAQVKESVDRLKAKTEQPKELTEAEQEQMLRESEIEDVLPALNVAQDLVREVKDEYFEKIAAEVRAELEARQAGDTAVTPEARQAGGVVPEPTGAAITSEADRISTQRQPTDSANLGSNQEVAGTRVSGEPPSSERSGVAGAGDEATGVGPVVPAGDAGRQESTGVKGALEGQNPGSIMKMDAVVKIFEKELSAAEQAVIEAQIKGDTRAEAAAQEAVAEIHRRARSWIEITADLENERFNDALGKLYVKGLITPEDFGFYESIANNNTRAALRALELNGKNVQHRILAKQLLRNNITPEVRFMDHGDVNNLGTYIQALDTVVLDSGYYLQRMRENKVADLEQTFLHELVHGGTVNALAKAYRLWANEGLRSTDLEYVKSAEYKAAAKLFETFVWIKDTQARYGDFRKEVHYGATNPLEMVAEAFVNPQFQAYLKALELPKEFIGSKPATAWEWLVEAVKKILKLEGVENNALAEIMADISVVMRKRAGPIESAIQGQGTGGFRYNRSLPTNAEVEGLKQFYADYPVSNAGKKKQGLKEATDQLREELERGNNPASEAKERDTPHDAIKGVNEETSKRESIAYRRPDGSYTFYEVNERNPMGDPDTRIDGLTHEQVTAKIAEKGHRADYTVGPKDLPKTSRSGLQGWKDGKWQFGAIAMKDEAGKPTGEWRVTTGPDLSDKSQPRTRTTLDTYDDVRKMFGAGGYSRTKKVEEARAAIEDRSGLPELTFTPPSEFVNTVLDKEASPKYLGQQAEFQAEQRGLLLPEALRPDLANVRKNSLIENDTDRVVRDRIKPLEAEGRKLVKDYGRSGKQFDLDITKLAYEDRATKLLNSPIYDATPEVRAQVTTQLAEAKQYLQTLSPQYRRALENYAKKVKQLSNEMYDYLADAGLIERSKADDIKNRYDFYVPMRTDEKSTIGKRATGLSDESVDPLLRIVNDWRIAIKRKYENEETKATYKLAEAYNIKLPNGENLFDLAPLHTYKFDQFGELTGVVDPLVLNREAVTTMIDGKPYRMAINDKGFLRALERVPISDTVRAINTTLHGMAMFNAIYGGFKTALSPVFAARNIIRDSVAALAQGDARIDRVMMGKELMNPKIWAAAIKEAAEPWLNSPAISDAKAEGALISRRAMTGLKPEQDRPTIRLDPTLMQRAGDLRKGLFSFEHGKVSNLLTLTTKTTENVVRMAVYSAAMKSPKLWQSIGRANGTTGKAVEVALQKAERGQALTTAEKELLSHLRAEAGASAKNATVNFEPKGKISGPVNAMFVFANAKTQAARTFAERLGLSKIKGGDTVLERLNRGNRYTQAATLSALGMGIAAAMYGYKNDPEKYPYLSDQQKDDYLIFKSGGPSIPIAQEIGIAYTIGQALVDAQMNPRWPDESMRRAKAASRLGTRLVQAFWPGGSALSEPATAEQGGTSAYLSRLAQPTAFQLVNDIAQNRNTFGSPIVTGLSQGKPPKGTPLYMHNRDKVSPLARELTEGMHKAGVMDTSPQATQYWIDQFIKSQVDLVHAIAPTWAFFNQVFGEPKKTPDGEDRPNVLQRTFFQEAHPMALRKDIQEFIDYENNKMHDAGDKASEKLNLLKQGQKRASQLAKDKKYKEAEIVQRNTLKRYLESAAP